MTTHAHRFLRIGIRLALVMLFALGGGVILFAEDSPHVVIKIPDSDPLKQTITIANNMQKQYYQEQAGINEEAEVVLRTLKNPFIPKIPRKPAPVKETPTPPPEQSGSKSTEIPTAMTSPTPTPVLTKPNFKISGLVWETKQPQAIVDGVIMNVGESVNGWRIKSINREGVTVVNNDFEFILTP